MDYKETPEQKQVADYSVYLQLKDIKYTNEDIAKHLSYTKEELGFLISRQTFVNNLEYKLQQNEGNYLFNGTFYITQNVSNLLSKEEIIEIYKFTQDLVKQHKSIDYLQVFYHIEHNCKLFFIDQLDKDIIESKQFDKDANYCTLLLASDY